MYEEDFEEHVRCRGCEALVWRGVDPCFMFGDGDAVCLACGLSRGGTYDSSTEQWTQAPNIADLEMVEERERQEVT